MYTSSFAEVEPLPIKVLSKRVSFCCGTGGTSRGWKGESRDRKMITARSWRGDSYSVEWSVLLYAQYMPRT